MPATITVDAMELSPGDIVLLPGNRHAKVTARSRMQEHNAVEIHTTEGSYLTTHPCPCRVVVD